METTTNHSVIRNSVIRLFSIPHSVIRNSVIRNSVIGTFRQGFTLIELLVASILLGMLSTILTMIFNQSSIAWRTGVASVANLNDSRAALGTIHDITDELLPGLGEPNASGGASDNRALQYRTVSLWDQSQPNQLRRRSQRSFNFDSPTINWGKAASYSISDAQRASSLSVVGAGAAANNQKNFSVGVRSLGPDGKPDTADDINTWPEEID